MTTTVILSALSLGVTQLDAKGLSYEDSFVGTPDSIVGQRVADRHFEAGTGDPVIVISRADGAAAVQEAFQGTDGIAPDSVAAAPPKQGYAYLEGTLADPPDGEAATGDGGPRARGCPPGRRRRREGRWQHRRAARRGAGVEQGQLGDHPGGAAGGVPRGTRHRLQHLPDDPGARGGQAARARGEER